jgi:hypothetical protein
MKTVASEHSFLLPLVVQPDCTSRELRPEEEGFLFLSDFRTRSNPTARLLHCSTLRFEYWLGSAAIAILNPNLFSQP